MMYQLTETSQLYLIVISSINLTDILLIEKLCFSSGKYTFYIIIFNNFTASNNGSIFRVSAHFFIKIMQSPTF